MKPYTVYFAIGEKKLKMTVLALHPTHAEETVRSKVQVLKVAEVPLDDPMPEDSAFDSAISMLEEVIDALGGTAPDRPKRKTWRERLTEIQNQREKK